LSLQTKQPGEQIRKFAKERRQSARLRYAFAAVVLMGTVLLFNVFGTSVAGVLLLLGGLVASYYLYCNAQHLMKRAGDAQHGAVAEISLIYIE
jgi:hypothetical protein